SKTVVVEMIERYPFAVLRALWPHQYPASVAIIGAADRNRLIHDGRACCPPRLFPMPPAVGDLRMRVEIVAPGLELSRNGLRLPGIIGPLFVVSAILAC